MNTKGNRTAYLNVVEYSLAKVLELLTRDGLTHTEAFGLTSEAYELVFQIRDADTAQTAHETAHGGS
jgi:hypothetical protein